MRSAAKNKSDHRFLDEAGDTTFFGKGKANIIGEQGVSNCFILGLVHFREPIDPIRVKITALQHQVVEDPYFKGIHSIQKKIGKDGFFFHATDDVPEVRKLFYDFIRSIDCSFEAVVGRKLIDIYEKKHHGNEDEFYADLLSHLLKNKLLQEKKLVITVAARGKSTKTSILKRLYRKQKPDMSQSRQEKS